MGNTNFKTTRTVDNARSYILWDLAEHYTYSSEKLQIILFIRMPFKTL